MRVEHREVGVVVVVGVLVVVLHIVLRFLVAVLLSGRFQVEGGFTHHAGLAIVVALVHFLVRSLGGPQLLHDLEDGVVLRIWMIACTFHARYTILICR